MMEDFSQDQLQSRRKFLEVRAKTHIAVKSDFRWHQAAAATLLRDAGR